MGAIEKELTKDIRVANQSWSERMSSEVHDVQYDSDADILYVTYGKPKESFS